VGDEFGGAHVGWEAVVLGHVADDLPDLPGLRHRVQPGDARSTGRWWNDPEQDLDEGALAGAIRADEADDPRLDADVQAVERLHRTIVLRETDGLDQWHKRKLLRIPGGHLSCVALPYDPARGYNPSSFRWILRLPGRFDRIRDRHRGRSSGSPGRFSRREPGYRKLLRGSTD
jgi:hypothetical protein